LRRFGFAQALDPAELAFQDLKFLHHYALAGNLLRVLSSLLTPLKLFEHVEGLGICLLLRETVGPIDFGLNISELCILGILSFYFLGF
jgi:hypothetical protein